MPDWTLWREMARETIKAARTIQDECPRNAVSRFYYAAFQGTTAYLLYRKQQPPELREAWSHADTPELLREHLGTAVKSEDTKRDIQNRLRQLYKMRCDADYVSGTEISQRSVDKARKDAGYIVKVVEDILPER